jgi:hypothetical protein
MHAKQRVSMSRSSRLVVSTACATRGAILQRHSRLAMVSSGADRKMQRECDRSADRDCRDEHSRQQPVWRIHHAQKFAVDRRTGLRTARFAPPPLVRGGLRYTLPARLSLHRGPGPGRGFRLRGIAPCGHWHRRCSSPAPQEVPRNYPRLCSVQGRLRCWPRLSSR